MREDEESNALGADWLLVRIRKVYDNDNDKEADDGADVNDWSLKFPIQIERRG